MASIARRFGTLIPALTLVALLAPPTMAADRSVSEPFVLDLEAQLAVLQIRRQEVTSASPARVEEDVRRRAADLEVRTPVEELVDLLTQRATLALDLENCLLTEASCSSLEADLGTLEDSFVAKVGFSTAEFRRGRLETTRAPAVSGSPFEPFLANGLFFPPSGSTRTDPQHCSCSFSIASKDRWLNRWWGLECNNHGGHGVCSGNVDSGHSPGAGAMTGAIQLFFGTQQRYKECQDDHRTCFRGPIPTSKPGGGHWTNVCNCDTLHSQFSNPYQDFYGGDLTDSTLVQQASFNALADGPCGGSSVAVYEGIEEHDPICCDDPMGVLSGFAFVTEGTSVHDIPTSATNCNGGSQSGLPPYCGEFGATIRLVATCQTRNDDDFGSCYGKCGQLLADATCNCDFDCQQQGDCCWDYCDACAYSPDSPPLDCSAGGAF